MPKSTHTAFPMPFSPALALAISPSTVLDFHRATFGGLRMEDDPDGGKGGEDPKDKPDPEKGKGKEDDDKLGEPGKKALDAERDARKKAEKDLAALKSQMDGFFGGLKQALGVEDKKGDDPTEVITTLTERLGTLEHQSLVDRVAREHGITDEDDVEILKSAKDKDAMEKLATRLAPKGDDEDADGKDKGKGKTAPRHDPSQGKGGGGGGSRPTSVAQVQADRRAAREAKAAK